MYTANPQADLSKLQNLGYRKEGIAFHLFASGTPGTTEFYRWHNSANDDHYYSYDLHGGGKSLKGYVFEGSIGNIGTSRLTNTRELCKWQWNRSGDFSLCLSGIIKFDDGLRYRCYPSPVVKGYTFPFQKMP